MKMADHLLWLADETKKLGGGSSVMKRRAVSAAYYAVFHGVASCCARALLPGEPRSSSEYKKVYRALEHSSLKNVLSIIPAHEVRLRRIATLAANRQSERHRSDYSCFGKLYSPQECDRLLSDAKTAVNLIGELASSERKVLAVSLLFKNRP